MKVSRPTASDVAVRSRMRAGRRVSAAQLGSLLVLLIGVLGASSVTAQFHLPVPPDAPSEAEITRARESFVGALKDASLGRWPRAVLGFEEAYRHSGTPAALLNLAAALRESGRPADARVAVLELKRRHGAALDAESRARTDELYDSVTAVLLLQAAPAGVTVQVDGIRQPAGQTRFELAPGPHQLDVFSPGFKPFHWHDVIGAGAACEVVYQTQAEAVAAPASPTTGSAGLVLADDAGHVDKPRRGLPRWGWALIASGAALAVGAAVALPLALRDDGLTEPRDLTASYELP